MTKSFQPMLAERKSPDLSKLRLPIVCSPKLDGIRCVIVDGVPLSRTLKPIPNEAIRAALTGLPAFDGELIVGEMSGPGVMQRTTSGVMKRDGEPDWTYNIFDYFGNPHGFRERLYAACSLVHELTQGWPPKAHERLRIVPHELALWIEEVHMYERQYVAQGYEGLMLRDPNGAYKFGRSTLKEGGLLKLKRFHDHEATVIGCVEKMHNDNEATTDERGYTKRSTHKANKRPAGTLGALVCRTRMCADSPEVEFELGTGFTDEDRAYIWNERGTLPGALVKFKYQELTNDGKPRFPVWLGWRHPDDISGEQHA